jgi:hypothetical protein
MEELANQLLIYSAGFQLDPFKEELTYRNNSNKKTPSNSTI